MIEFFKEPNIDWMGKAKFFYALSGILLLAGWTSIYLNHGLRYSIDFKGGTNVDVRFAQPPNIDQIRSGLTSQGLGNSEIQSISGGALGAKSNEVLIFVEQKGQGDEALDQARAQVITALNSIYGVRDASKPDFNAATPSSLAAKLNEVDPLHLSTNAGDRYPQLAKKILAYRDDTKGGVISSFDELSGADGVTPQVLATLKSDYALGSFAIRNVEIVGPKVGGELRRQAGIYCVPIRVGVRGSRSPCGISRRFNYPGLFFTAEIRDFADGHRGASHARWLFDERHHRDFRPDSGE
jgi:preprotein translocase subunit SecF